jgi:uncharacterized 2Fe-2S/4Fe-4S cluster protein (DUF4445 family)
MARLLLRSGNESHWLEVHDGQSVRDVLDATEWRVRAACGGSGTCGACVIKLISGEVSPLTVAEYMKLTPDERAAGTRLACQLRLRGDSEILLDQPAPPSQWKSIPSEELPTHGLHLPDLTSHIYGVAVDLGTTHIRVALWDRKHGQRIATRRGPNPQGSYGADVLNRLHAAQKRPEAAADLAKLARTAIVQAVRDILARDVGEVSPMLAEIGELVIVGNTAMLALLTGNGVDALMATENWQQSIDCQPLDARAWQAQWFMPHARITLPSPVAGFVGSDLVADLLATGIGGDEKIAMLIDIGTNTEIALWDGTRFHITSVPGGPAFEAVGIRHGMPAEVGAIYQVQATENGFALSTLGGDAARGFCGSGLVDAIAVLRERGVLKASGRFATSPGPEGYRLDPDIEHSAVTGIDIDAFQRAKAAIAAGMMTLLQRAGLTWPSIERLCICGAFGQTLNVAHAQSLGLLPPVDPTRISLFGDASLAGAECALLRADGAGQMEQLTRAMEEINLSLVPGYDDTYIDQLRLQPMSGQG